MGNPIIKQFKMRRNGGEANRAAETSATPYSMNQERTMNNMGMVDSGMNMGHPMNYGTPALKHEKGHAEKVQVGSGASNRLSEVVVSAPSVETLNKKAENLAKRGTTFSDRDQIDNQGIRNVARGSTSKSLKSLSPKNKERLNQALSGAKGTRTVDMMARANKRRENQS